MALTLDNLKPIYPKYDYKYTDNPKEACCTYLSDDNPFNVFPADASKSKNVKFQDHAKRMNVDWRGKSRGLFFNYNKIDKNVTCGKTSEDCKVPVPKICRGRTRTRCTQTCYRESSAQTRSYLPEIGNKTDDYKNFEIYQISKLLDSVEPPGEYEAKVVERARRRRKYQQALKLLEPKDRVKLQAVLEALEWEDWVAREEYTQGCQMLRMKIVELMFNNREQKLRENSDQRIISTAEKIQQRRNAQLLKINIEYDRNVRRLEAKRQKINRFYRKGNITQEHIDPASDLHAPQMRFGVNPNRRHFLGYRKHFEERLEKLTSQAADDNLPSLACPFSKLRSWAKPKEKMKEITYGFCSDENLKHLYESLKGLRIQSRITKRNPRCLVKKSVEGVRPTMKVPAEKVSRPHKSKPNIPESLPVEESESEEELKRDTYEDPSLETKDEIEMTVGEYEADALGSLLHFLCDELERLKLQKKFQAIHLLAKKERWQREAYEAGLRQRENKQRVQLEERFSKEYETRQDTCSLFLESVLEKEFNFTNKSLSTQNIAELAEKIFEQRDGESVYGDIKPRNMDRQTFDRMTISEMVKTQVLEAAEERFSQLKVQNLQQAHVRAIEAQLYASVETALAMQYQTPDIICIVGEIIDDLIDFVIPNDMDNFSPSSSEGDLNVEAEVNDVIDKIMLLSTGAQKEKEEKREGKRDGEEKTQDKEEILYDFSDINMKETIFREARALIRKIARRAIPEERWKQESDRIIEETLSQTFNDAFFEIECLKISRGVKADKKLEEIITDIYNRLSVAKKKSPENKTSPKESVSLKSFSAQVDIFQEKLPKPSSIKATYSSETDSDAAFKPDRLMSSYEYVDRLSVAKYEPAELRKCQEHMNIFQLSDESSVNDSSSSSNDDEVIGTKTKQKDEDEDDDDEDEPTTANKDEKQKRTSFAVAAIFPDLPHVAMSSEYHDDPVSIMTRSYERASGNYDKVALIQERHRSSNKSKDSVRRSSFS